MSMNFGGGGQYDALLQEIMRQQQTRAQRPEQAPMPQMGGQVMQSAPANVPQYQGGGEGGALASAPQTIEGLMRAWRTANGGQNGGATFSFDKALGNNFGFSPADGGGKA